MIGIRAWFVVTASLAAFWLGGCVTVGPPPLPTQKVDLHQASATNTELALGYLDQGRLDLAFEKVKRAVSEDDDNPQAHAAMALIYSRRDNPVQAEKEYRRAIAIAPDEPNIQNLFGAFLCGHNKPDEGIVHFTKAAENLQFVTPEQAWTNAGICAMNNNHLDKAAQYLSKAVEVAPNYPDALLSVGDLNYRLRQYTRALAFLERYQSLAKPTPQWLLLMVKTERQLGDFDSSRNYESQLTRDFPTSEQAAQIRQKSNS